MGRGRLAIDGGRPIRREPISYGRQSIDATDEKAVIAALHSDWLTQGPLVERFESEFAAFVGRKHAVAFCNATAALHGAYEALGVGPGRSLLTSPMTFAATANAALFLGADVHFADVKHDSGLVDPKSLELLLDDGIEDLAVLSVVHYAGALADMNRIPRIARRHGLRLVEDACHALGATGYDSQAGKFGDIAVFSFHPVKPITTAEGGMAVTDSRAFAERMRTFRTHGISKTPEMARRFGPWHNEMRFLGYNYRLSELHSALGLSQLRKFSAFLRRRQVIAASYDEFFADMESVRPLTVPVGTRSAYHLYPILIDERRFRGGRRAVVEALVAEGIVPQVHYVPVNSHPYYRQLGHRPAQTPRALAFSRSVFSLPIFPAMSDADVSDVCNAVEKVVTALRR
ncbi:MAG: UDP-4-amino-4,6-dideoxy-N-acetyl-beta-L-altrosamine transaminase [Deltaproteobacteria bacterium]|nr:UDP-4-amino-4,6-dideoxy-N-acetyl-beta-L-altrosamine transaminase [Deltaproteobacteria bacterium]